MDFTDAVISDLKGKAKGSLVDYSGAQAIVNAVKALDSLNSEAAQSISRLVQRCTDEYQKLISDPSMSELVPSQLEIQQVLLKTGIAARDAKATKAKTGEDKTSAGSQLKQDDDENIDGEPLPGEEGAMEGSHEGI